MSFWDLSDGTSAADNVSTEHKEVGFSLIPDKTNALAEICKAEWKKAYESTEQFIEITWAIEKPVQFSGYKVLQRLWVTDLDPNAKDKDDALKKRNTARTKLARIDAFGKGRLMASGKSDFTDDDLALALVGTRGVVFIMQGETKGNPWNRVVQINPLDTEIKAGPEDTKAKPSGGGGRPSGGAGGGFDMDDDSIPF